MRGIEYGIMGTFNKLDNRTRTLALLFVSGTLIGSLTPEFGNLISAALNLGEEKAHIFNPVFFVLGIIGIGMVFYIGYKRSR